MLSKNISHTNNGLLLSLNRVLRPPNGRFSLRVIGKHWLFTVANNTVSRRMVGSANSCSPNGRLPKFFRVRNFPFKVFKGIIVRAYTQTDPLTHRATSLTNACLRVFNPRACRSEKLTAWISWDNNSTRKSPLAYCCSFLVSELSCDSHSLKKIECR